MISDLTPAEVEAQFAPAFADGLVTGLDGACGAATTVRFRHDRVQQAALSRLDPTERRSTHLRLARRMATWPQYAGIAAAMYAAKSAGRGTFRLFQSSMSEQIEHRLRLEMELRTAVGDGELELRYQPKISLTTGELLGLEALIRWRHRRHGLLVPADLLPMAEEVGLGAELEDWVFQEVFRQSLAWRTGGFAGVRLPPPLSAGCAISASASRSMISGLATPASPTCTGSRSTC